MNKPLIAVVSFVFVAFAVACQSEEEEDLENRSLDEHACDEAAARLAECCPGVRKESIGCRVRESSGGCDSRRTTTDVLITMHDADECILHSSCEQMREGGVCDALATAVPESSGTSSGDPSTHTEHVSVCPSLRSAWTESSPSTSSSSSSGWPSSSSSSSSSSSGGATLPPEEPAPEATPCEGDASTCSWWHSESACEAAGCTWIPQ
jgi:hypothetical protein